MVAAAFVLSAFLGSLACTFPGSATQCVSSRPGIMVEWREADSHHSHELRLQCPGEDPVLLAEFGRSVDVLWSPDGTALAITDHSGSNESAAWIVRISRPTEREDLELAFNREFGKPAELYRHGHRYFRALSWVSPTTLLFDVHAYDATPEQYRATFAYTSGGVVRRSEKQ